MQIPSFFIKSFQACNISNQSKFQCPMPQFSDESNHMGEARRKRSLKEGSKKQQCDPDLVHHPFEDHNETTITEVGISMYNYD